MALDISFSSAIDADRTAVTLTDTTTFGSPNVTRAGCGVFVSAAKVDSDNNETDLTVSTDDSDPETDSTFTFTYNNGDGWYKVRYVAVPDYDAGTTYALYDAVFDSSTDTVYRSKTASNTGNSLSSTTYWEEIEDEAGLADFKGEDNESSNIDSLVWERVFTSNAQYAYGNLISENCMCEDFDDPEILYRYQIFSLWLNGAITADERTEVITGEKICRKIQSEFIDA